MQHKLTLTPGHVDWQGNVEPPWKCEICGRYFRRHTNAKTCKGTMEIQWGKNNATSDARRTQGTTRRSRKTQ